MFFNIYLEDALRRVRNDDSQSHIKIEHSYSKVLKTQTCQGKKYNADDFTTKSKEKKEAKLRAVEKIFPTRNLKANQDKSEHTVLERGARNTKTWRNVKKAGSLLGDTEDII